MSRGKLLTASDLIRMMEDNRKPFDQWEEGGLIIRDFHRDAPWWLFKWHRDEADRVIWATHLNDWLFQYEDEEPFKIGKNQLIEIPEGVLHRLIPGETKLRIAIKEIK